MSNGSGIAGPANVQSVVVTCGPLPANVRLVDNSRASLQLSFSGGYSLTRSAGGDWTDYGAIPSGVYIAMLAGGTVGTSPVSVGFAAGQSYSALAFLRSGAPYCSFITENIPAPAAGLATVNVANVSPDPGPLDLYIVPAGTVSWASQGPTFSAVTGLSTAVNIASSNALATPPDTWEIVATAAGNAADVRLELPAVHLSSGQAYTLGLTGSASGSLVDAVLIPQRVNLYSAAFYPAAKTRIRVLSALPQTTQVNVTAGATPLAAAFAPSPTPYALVDSASAIAAITVTPAGGPSFSPSLPALQFGDGLDYTILVYGDGSTPAGTMVSALTDFNLLNPNLATVRLINGAIPGPSAAMVVDGTTTANAVLYGTDGTVTTYVSVVPDSAATIAVTGFSYSYTLAPVNLAGGHVYSVIVYSTTSAPIVVQDR